MPTTSNLAVGELAINIPDGKLYFNQSGTITLLTSVAGGNAVNLTGGAANQVPYQTGASTTSFITAPTVSGTALTWNGSAIGWSQPVAVSIANTGGWSVTPSGTKLYFNYNGTNVASLDSSGNFITLGSESAGGTP
jgi:hypothetical protein